jgi:polysaccharide export outer membrane protein
MTTTIRLLTVLSFLSVAVDAAQTEYRIRPDDTLMIGVIDQPDLTKKYTVDAQGLVSIPFIGAVAAKDLTADQLSLELKRRFIADGLLKDPQVTVQVDRTKRVFVFGGVTSPGTYQMTERMTLLEVLARSGYNAASEAIIVRTKGATGPVMPGDDKNAEVIRINLREFEKDIERGQLARNVELVDGDTIYVPRFDPNRVYVSGQVRTPGAYSVPEGTTILQLLTLAGGPTEAASLGRIRVIRMENGKQKTINKVKMDHVVQAGDTIIVPERYF